MMIKKERFDRKKEWTDRIELAGLKQDELEG